MMDPEKSKLLEELVEVQKRHAAVVRWHGILQNGDYDDVAKTLAAIIAVGDTAHWARATHLPEPAANQPNTNISKTKRKTPVSAIREKLRTWRRRVDSSLTLVYDDLHLVDRRLATEKGPPRNRPVARLEMLTLAAKMAIAPTERDSGWRRRGVGIGPSGNAIDSVEPNLHTQSQLPPRFPPRPGAEPLQQQPDSQMGYTGNTPPVVMTQGDGQMAGDSLPAKNDWTSSDIKYMTNDSVQKNTSSDEQTWDGEEHMNKFYSKVTEKNDNTNPLSDEKQELSAKEKREVLAFTHEAISDLLVTSGSSFPGFHLSSQYHGSEASNRRTILSQTKCTTTHFHEGATTSTGRSTRFAARFQENAKIGNTETGSNTNGATLVISGSEIERDTDEDNYGGDIDDDSDALIDNEDDDDDDNCIQRASSQAEENSVVSDENKALSSKEDSRGDCEQRKVRPVLSWTDETVLALTGLCGLWWSTLRATWQLAAAAVASRFRS